MVVPAASVVMIVASNAFFIYMMQYYAKTSGHQVVIAPLDGEVVAFAKKNKPAVIILESDVAEPTSLEILLALKHDEVTRKYPVIVCSWQAKDENNLVDVGDNYLQKPVSYNKFLAALDEVIDISGI